LVCVRHGSAKTAELLKFTCCRFQDGKGRANWKLLM